jgi:hypothetical protein
MRHGKLKDFIRLFYSLLFCALLGLSGANTANARFLTPDTWDPILAGVDFNRYAYGANDPINQSDPNGHSIDSKTSTETAEDKEKREAEELRRKTQRESSRRTDRADDIDDSRYRDIWQGQMPGGGVSIPKASGGGVSIPNRANSLPTTYKPQTPTNIRSNALNGLRREESATTTLRAQNPNKPVVTQRTLRDAQGKKLVDPQTEEGRRVDNAVLDPQAKTAKTYEVTGPNVNKVKQQEKEGRIFDQNPSGVYVRDSISGDLYSVTHPSERFNVP